MALIIVFRSLDISTKAPISTAALLRTPISEPGDQLLPLHSAPGLVNGCQLLLVVCWQAPSPPIDLLVPACSSFLPQTLGIYLIQYPLVYALLGIE